MKPKSPSEKKGGTGRDKERETEITKGEISGYK